MIVTNLGLIACVDKNWAIGYNNRLLYCVPEDLKRFKELTTGNIVIMGRKTLESLPNHRPLPNRTNIVVTRQQFDVEGAIVVHTVDDAIDIVSKQSALAYVIGGGEVYRTMLPYCSFAEITKIDDASSDADTWLPSLDTNPEWDIVRESGTYQSSNLQIPYRFVRYGRKNISI